ncbi:MAG TPA: 2-amino-4-hydroxy-6-hydroxymethyldihydropteridine diphosphokinase [Desulfotomaculum sp.]|nr:MAG: 7,8-dihydro-6-hydroxymethylpterin-pyrophosphokinase [Desulfotomaculum sp. 46_80]KUK85395.1 MAG: 7,8-dihydro-6-hydroxymethylpterin-pyrophosphokinase [Desulfofundulus kuznetsovii]HAG10654.1 2-amino-4-hydroxy-6-hydroxymethyldihydropteridine diphosphokinase [Desulfotomaculum sp.]HBY03384.1 2-amino-4-hydroxy-6-hydroxymethyldihydropteridine diphosphokinase [Desulfotomaculum sp.]
MSKNDGSLAGRVRAFISLGSNLGDKRANLERAVELLSKVEGLDIKAVSSFYRTLPVGPVQQDWFINNVLELMVELTPRELLNVLLIIEKKMGRERDIRWGPRLIDLDILLYGDTSINEPDLVIPHPRMFERAFMIIPLAELDPELCLPGLKNVSILAAELAFQDVQKIS